MTKTCVPRPGSIAARVIAFLRTLPPGAAATHAQMRDATAAAQAAARNAEAQHDRGTAATTSPVGGPMGAGQAAAAAPSRAIEPAILNLGAICGRLGFTVNAAFLADTLHVHAAKVDKASRLYTETQYQAICRQIVAHVAAMAELYSGETA